MSLIDKRVAGWRMTANLNDFDGNVQEWKLAFYEVWRCQMTWSFAYDIAVRDSASSGVFIDLLVKEAFKENAEGMLDSLGYQNVSVGKEMVGIIWPLEHESMTEYDALYLDY